MLHVKKQDETILTCMHVFSFLSVDKQFPSVHLSLTNITLFTFYKQTVKELCRADFDIGSKLPQIKTRYLLASLPRHNPGNFLQVAIYFHSNHQCLVIQSLISTNSGLTVNRT